MRRANDHRTVRGWDINNGQSMYVTDGHTDWVNQVSIHPHENLVFSASRDRTMRSWNLKGGQIVRVFGSKKDKFVGEKLPKIQAALVIIQLIVNFLQVIAFNFSIPGGSSSWSSSNPLLVLPVIRLDLPNTSFVFWLLCSIAIFFALLFYTSYKYQAAAKNGGFPAFLWGVAWLTSWLCSTVLFIPTLQEIIKSFTCRFSSNSYDATHIVAICISALVLIVYVPLVFRLVHIGSDLNKIGERSFGVLIDVCRSGVLLEEVEV